MHVSKLIGILHLAIYFFLTLINIFSIKLVLNHSFVAAVQHERGPRNSTIRRQMAMLFKDPSPPSEPIRPIPSALDLAMPKHNLLSLLPNPYIPSSYSLNRLKYPEPLVPMRVGSPTIITSAFVNHMEPEAICESAARILFMNVKWVKNVPAFTSLSFPDRLLLLEESWKELFVLGTAQFLYPIALRRLFNPLNSRLEMKDLEAFETALAELARIRPDTNEYACLRGLALFKTTFVPDITPLLPDQPPKIKRLQDIPTVAALQEQSRVVLNEVINMYF